MFKGFIEWLEGEPTRGRKVVLMTTIFVYLASTVLLLLAGTWLGINEAVTNIYMLFTGTAITVYAFYTGTNAQSDSSSVISDTKNK